MNGSILACSLASQVGTSLILREKLCCGSLEISKNKVINIYTNTMWILWMNSKITDLNKNKLKNKRQIQERIMLYV